MRIKKEIFQILVWSLAVIIVVPLFIYFFSDKEENNVSFSSEEDFSFIFESTEEVFLPNGAIPVVSARLEDEEFKIVQSIPNAQARLMYWENKTWVEEEFTEVKIKELIKK